MLRPTQIAIPTLVRVKDGALDRLGIYLGRGGHRRVAVLVSKGLVPPLPDRLAQSLKRESIEPASWTSRKPTPPTPLIYGSTTPSATAIATTASTADPPDLSMSMPTAEASG